ncbi:riboflavin synthase [Emcibacteraceae bacterium]|jgi:riboflavin synthase|uniref:riboflavin synthase n=1 Tax=Pseudemcibacter sp. TaxID=2943293 RepID=UPI00230EB5A5|nr:riboflavin synthase [Kordiimonadaceae bacterium]MDA7568382.1 riboflavin synthase [Emcibacteraceae bacterium]MDA9553577.1 riboflavin synthase [Emcibacteraceae bacterium]MDA9770683.1 riboflavin synthase [Emcibacteraceae bacterium]
MFTGIITDIGEVSEITQMGDTRIVIRTSYDTSTIDFGASIACSGVCLTVVDKGSDYFSVDVSAETLSCTSLGDWLPGSQINLERALKVGEELGGHIVTGHVDTVGQILNIETDGDSKKFTFSLPTKLKAYVASKGSVTINGASLTVNNVEDKSENTEFSINIIPHTQEKTTFGAASIGDKINIEIDILARYVARMREV